MELFLHQVDYTEAGGVTARGCMQVLPGEHSRTGQKVAIGNAGGELRLFGVNQQNSAVEDVYRIPAFDGTPVRCMCIAPVPESDKVAIFVGGKATADVCGDIRAYSKRKKVPFLDFNTHLSDPICTMDVKANDLFIASDGMFNHFSNCVDHGFFAPPHNIAAMSYIDMDDSVHAVIGCEDRLLRVLKNSDDADPGMPTAKDILYEVEVPGQPRALLPFSLPDAPRKELLYGTKDGRLGLTSISQTRIRQRFCLPNDKKLGSIDTMALYDLDDDGIPEIICGRSDGHVDVFRTEPGAMQPIRCFQHEFAESVASVSGGCVGSNSHREALVATYSGRIMGLTSDLPAVPAISPLKQGSVEVAGNNQHRIAALKKEIEDLQVKLTTKQQELSDQGSGDTSAVEYIADHYIEIKDDFSFQEADGNYLLTLETQFNMDFLTLRADVIMDVLDAEKNTVLPSKCAETPEYGTMVAYTFRCQPNTRRVELKIRPIEGQQGTMSVMVVPAVPLSKLKVARELTYPIRPLCLHSILHGEVGDRPFSTLRFSGKARAEDIHAMLYSCLPSLGDRPQSTSDGDEACMLFQSAVTKTVVRITYMEDKLLLESDNVSSLTIFKEFLTKQLIERRLDFTSSADINPDSVPWMLRLLHDRICHQLAIAQKLQLWKALKEVELSEGAGSISSPEYKEILERGDELRRESESSNSLGERLFGTITDLYIDFYRMEGVDSKSRVDLLLQLLDSYNLDALLDFFTKDPKDPAQWSAQA